MKFAFFFVSWALMSTFMGLFIRFHQRASTARRNALFLDRVGHGNDSDELAALDNRPERYAKRPWMQNLLRDMPLINEAADLIGASGLQVTVAMVLLRSACGLTALVGLGIFTGREAAVIACMAAVGAAAPWLWIQRARRKRAQAFEAQLPQALELIALYLRSGRSLPQAFVGATEELASPASEEFLGCAEEYRLGRPLDAALKKLAHRYIESVGFRLFTIAVSVLGQTGGNLVEVLERIKKNLDATITYTLRLRALTGESRISAWILGSLPGVFMLAATLLNPNYFAGFTGTQLGRVLFFVFLALWGTGLMWVRRLLNSKLA